MLRFSFFLPILFTFLYSCINDVEKKEVINKGGKDLSEVSSQYFNSKSNEEFKKEFETLFNNYLNEEISLFDFIKINRQIKSSERHAIIDDLNIWDLNNDKILFFSIYTGKLSHTLYFREESRRETWFYNSLRKNPNSLYQKLYNVRKESVNVIIDSILLQNNYDSLIVNQILKDRKNWRIK